VNPPFPGVQIEHVEWQAAGATERAAQHLAEVRALVPLMVRIRKYVHDLVACQLAAGVTPAVVP
jgi:hypothetical protein